MKHIKAALITGIIFVVLYLVAIFIDYCNYHYREITINVLKIIAFIISISSVYFFAYESIKDKNKTEK